MLTRAGGKFSSLSVAEISIVRGLIGVEYAPQGAQNLTLGYCMEPIQGNKNHDVAATHRDETVMETGSSGLKLWVFSFSPAYLSSYEVNISVKKERASNYL